MDRFAVIQAVPGSSVSSVSSVAAVSDVEVGERLRAAKTTGISTEDIPAGFSPVPAVPAVRKVPAPAPLSRRRQPVAVTTPRPSGFILQEDVVSQQTTSENLFQSSEPSTQRKAFKRCHGKCVQKFCLPIDDLDIYDTCSVKCKGICKQ